MASIDNKPFWERAAKHYTLRQEESNKELYQQTIEHIEPYLTKDMKVLEIACGTGQFTFSLCDKVAYFEATDFSEKMINEAKKIRNNGITYSIQDATHLTYKDNYFDAILIANALHIMPDPATALNEINRVLKTNGLLIAPTFVFQGKINKKRLRLLEYVGFKTFFKWTSESYNEYILNHNFKVIENKVFIGKILPECLIIAKKN